MRCPAVPQLLRRRTAENAHAPRDPSEPQRSGPRVGLVLGGGGAVGAAYHAGALAALEHDLGWDARTADVILGTSAGSLVGALLRLGFGPMDLAAFTVDVPTQSVSEPLEKWALGWPTLPPISPRHLVRKPRLPRPPMLLGLTRVAARQRVVPVGALSMFLPNGRETLAPHLELLDGITDGTWPEQPLLVCAVRRRDWRRTTFGPHPSTVSLSTALAASCAVPGYFADVALNGDTYVDGGVISATNADLLKTLDLDLVIVVSPMTGESKWPSVSHVVRHASRRVLNAELRSLHHHSIPTVVVEPSRSVTQHMSMDFMSDTAAAAITRAAFFDTGIQITKSPFLRSLSSRGGGRSTAARNP